MKKVIKNLALALTLVGLWFISAYFVAEVWLPSWWAINCGFINALLGAIALYLVTRTERGARLFYEGPSNGGWVIIALLWSIPGVIIIVGLVWWGLRFVLQWWKF